MQSSKFNASCNALDEVVRPSANLLSQRRRAISAVAIACISGLALSGCGAGGYAGGSITGLSSSAVTLDAGQSMQITASVSGAPSVVWSLNGSACTENSCGTLSTSAGSSTTYSSPQSTASPMQVKLTASVSGALSLHTSMITVNPDPAINASLPSGTVGAAYSATITTSGGTVPINLSIGVNGLPAGLSFDATTGVVSGTPTVAGTFPFTATLVDSSNVPFTVTAPETITIHSPGSTPPPLSPLSLGGGIQPAGKVGSAYATSLPVNGGVAPYTWGIASGILPTGLSLSPSTGVISGMPTAQGPSSFMAQATDSTGATASAAASIQINAANALALTTTKLPNGTVGVIYSAGIGAAGGTNPYSCAIVGGALPAGLSLDGCMVIGTPSVAGTAVITVKVTDSSNPANTLTGQESIVISPAVLLLSTTALPNGTVGSAYSATIAATGGTAPYTCAITAGSLPSGLALSGCMVSGTPAVAGTTTITVKVTDSSNPASTAIGPETIVISPVPLSLSTTTLPSGIVGTAYNATIGAAGGTSPYSCAITGGSLPSGLNISACAISGTPAAAGSSTIAVKITDASNPAESISGPETITISPAALSLSTTMLPGGTVGVSYNATIGANGGTSPYNCTITGGVLPAGLSITGCTITGTPGTAGSSTVTVKVTDSGSPAQSITGPETIIIAPATLVLTATTLSNGTVGIPYSSTIGASGGTSPYSCAITGGLLPAGLALTGCTVSGTPTAAGNSSVTVKVTDSGSPAESVTGAEAITISPAALTLSSTALPNGTVGIAYSATIGANGGTAPYDCAILSGTLPAGLSLSGCVVSGTPTAAAISTIIVKATDSGTPAQNITGPETITIAPATLTLTAGLLPNGTVGVAYNSTIGASGGTSPYACAITSGTLPIGLTLTGCTVSGTPASASNSTLTVRVTDSGSPSQNATGTETITISPATLTLSTTALPNGTVGIAYSATIVANGGTTPYSCLITSGTLPAGLALTGCTVSGTPTAAATSTVTVKVTDSGSPAQNATGPETITIAPATLTLTASSLANGTVGVAYSSTIGVSGGTSPYMCAITGGTLPAGLTLAGCTVSGTPATAETSTLTVKVTDAGSPAQNVVGTESITIAPAALYLATSALPNGNVGIAYIATIGAGGGTTPYNCAITNGALPSGLMLTGCVVSGTPTAAGTSTVTVKVTDSGSPAQNASGLETITIGPATLALTATALPGGTVGDPYSATIGVTGGTAPYSCAVTSGTLPAGLTLTGCTVSGTPTAAGTSTVTVKVTDSGSPAQNITGPETIVIAPAALTLVTTALPNGTVGLMYSATIAAGGGTSPYNCAITAGTLPSGLSLAGCIVTGTPTTAGASTITVKVTDSGSPAQNVSGQETITIAPATLTLTSTALPDGQVGSPYSATIGATGGTSPYSCAITAGTLPAGLTLTGCNVSGTPATAGSSTVTVKVTDSGSPAQNATGLETIVIAPATLTLAATALPNGTVGVAYSGTIGATGGTSPYSCIITTGTLPSGLTLTGCSISGTPTASGAATITIKVTDSGSPAQNATGPETITIAPATLVLTATSLPSGTVGITYNTTIGVSGGTSPYSCAITSGTLPAGLTLSGCTVSGTPTTAGASTVTVKITDSGSPAQNTTGLETITIAPAALILTATALPNGIVGVAYSATIGASGGTSPYNCTITSGTLPAGLALSGCTIAGTPTASGTTSVTVKVTDSGSPAQNATGPETITIAPATLVLSTTSLPNGTVGVVYSATIGASGGTSPYSCTIISGTLSAGLILNGCAVSGTPTTAGAATITVKVSDSGSPAQSATGPETITIAPAPLILTTTTLPEGTVGISYSGTIGTSGGTSPYSCTVTTGTLPAGLTLSGCTISGTPTAPGTSSITVKVTDSGNPAQTTTGSETITIDPAALTLNATSLPNGTYGIPYSAAIGVSGGTTPYSCSITAGTLPAGLTLNGCAVSGTPAAVITSTVIVKVTDQSSPVKTVTGPETIVIAPSGTLSLTGTLSNATLNTAYSYTFQATGGAPPYSYSLTAGTLPAGLNLAADGVLNGTPTAAGASSFTVTVTDSAATPATASLPVVLLVAYAAGINDAELHGPYAYLFQGYDDVLVGVLAYQQAAVGSFTADGVGGITAGELDANHQSSNPSGTTVATSSFLGTYQVNADNRGLITITTLNTNGTTNQTITYAISLKAPTLPATASAQGTFIEFDGNAAVGSKGSGTLLAQTTSSFAAGLNGSYAFGLSGDTPCLVSCTVGIASGPVATVGQFTANGPGSISSGLADANIASVNFASAPLSGSSQTADQNGRVQLELNNTSISDGLYPSDFAAYIVSANEAFLVSTDKHSAYTLLAGTAQLQTISTFNNTGLNGPFIGYENAQSNPGLLGTALQSVLNFSTATVFRASSNGAGTCNTTNSDSGGITSLVNGITGLLNVSQLTTALTGVATTTGNSSCTIASNGRGVLNYPAPSGLISSLLSLLGLPPGAPSPRIFYLIGPNHGYFLESGYAGLGQFEPQTGNPFSTATLNATFLEQTVPASSLAGINTSGYFTANGSGNVNYTLDENVGVGTLNVLQLGTTGTTTYTLSDSNSNTTAANAGRYVFANGTTVIYAISPGRFVMIDTNPTTTSPSVSLLY